MEHRLSGLGKAIAHVLLLLLPLAASAQGNKAPLTLADIAGSPNFSLTSTSFQNNQALPAQSACKALGGKNQIPSLTWKNEPTGTVTYALTIIDPDAPKGAWLHWFIYNIPGSTHSLDGQKLRLIGKKKNIVRDAYTQKPNSWGNTYYQGPCPPSGAAHHYVFTLYALSQTLAPVVDYKQFQYLVKSNPGLVLSHTQITGMFPANAAPVSTPTATPAQDPQDAPMQKGHYLIALILLLLDIWAWVNIYRSERGRTGKIIWSVAILILPLLGFLAWWIAGPRRYKA